MNPHPPGADHAEDDIDQQALDWYVRSRDGLSPAQRQAFDQWMREPAHREAYACWERDWRGLDALAPRDVAMLRQGGAPISRAPDVRRRRMVLGGMGMAACAALAAVGARQYWGTPLNTQTMASAPGETHVAALPDGRRIELDTATRVAVAQYDDRIEISLLQGQAWLEAPTDRALPCQVTAGSARLIADGRLCVRYTPGQAGYEQVHVAVETGQAQLLPSGDALRRLMAGLPQPILLSAGQQAWQGDGGEWHTRPVALSAVASWRDARLVIDDQPLANVLGEFARYGHVVPQVDDIRVARMRITGTFHPHQPETLYRVLPQILPVRFERRPGGPAIVLVTEA